MLHIRPEQMAAFAAADRRRFEDRLLGLWATGGGAASDPNALRGRIRAMVEHASRYDLTDEAHAACYVRAGFAFGDNFDRDPALAWAGRLLNDPTRTPGEKAAQLDGRAVAAGF